MRIGFDVYQTAAVTAFGEFALVQVDSSTDGGGGGGVNVGLLAGGVGLLVLAGIVLLIRRRRVGNVAL